MNGHDNDQQPAFANAGGCLEWLTRMPAADVVHRQAMLLRQANLLNQAPLAAAERLEILEALRPTVHETQEAFGRKFAGKPLPLTAPEQAAFDSCRALWHALASGYMRCAEACFAGDANMKAKAALVLERALAALVAGQYETHRAGQVPSADHWRTLHQVYAAAEQLKVAEQGVFDGPRAGKTPVSAAATYAEAMLLAAAGLHEHSRRQVAWVARWARRWAAKVRMLTAPPASAQAFPLCVDLGSAAPAGYRPIDAPGARWLETVELRRSLKKRLLMLEKGESPAMLNLGDDCTQPACEQLLRHAYQRWCKGGAIRGYERRPASGNCRFVAGIEAIHYYLSDSKPFKAPGTPTTDMLRRERDEIATFGRVATHHDENFSEQHGYAVEDWQLLENWHMLDASATGLRLGRTAQHGGLRIGHGHLVAVRPDNARVFLLGCVRWALLADALQVGVYLFPGQPVPVALRGSGLAAAGEKYRQSFLLPAVAAIGQEATVVMPVGTFKLGRTVEVFTDQPRRLRLTRLVERGADFERAGYEPA